jgi:RHS repeat-associated protein
LTGVTDGPDPDAELEPIKRGVNVLDRVRVDRWGQPTALTDPLNATTTVTYNTAGLPIRSVLSVDPGAVDTAAYNANGLPTYVRSADGPADSIVYHGTWVTQPTSVSAGGAPTQTIYRGTNGRADSVKIGTTFIQRYTYETDGRVKTVKDALGTMVSTGWHSGTNGNRSKDSVPGGLVTTYGYDVYGRATTVTPPNTPTRTTYYDVLNRPDSVRDGVNAVATRFTYDDASNLLSVRDPQAQVYGFAYNAVGWTTSRTDPASGTESLLYDVEGRLTRWVNRRGDTTRYRYDALHRSTGKSGAQTDSTAITYSTNRRHVTASSWVDSSQVVAVDEVYLSPLGLVDSTSTSFWGTAARMRHYLYSAAGVLDSVWVKSFSGSTFLGRKYFFDTARGTLDSVRIGGKTRSSRFDANLRDTLTVLASGDSTFREYLQGGQSSGLVMSSATKQSFNRYLGYDNTGRLRLQFTDSIPEPFSATFGYDGLGRVVADTSGVVDGDSCDHDAALGWSCDYDSVEGVRRLTYDAAGNVKRDSLWDNLGFVGADTGGYSTGNRIEVFGACTYDHDADGNVTSRACGEDSLALWWSSDNHLDSLSLNGTKARFYYDAFGRLVKRSAAGGVRYFWWDGENLYAEINGSGSMAKIVEYLSAGMDNPRAIATADSTVYFAGIDGLGNVIGLESHTGGDGAAYAYDLWGNNSGWENLPSGATNRARFKGAMWMGDAGPELYYMRARWYEPQTGRFVSEDPIGLAGGMNLYVYAGNDPVNGWDPTGLYPCLPYKYEGYCGPTDGNGADDFESRWQALIDASGPYYPWGRWSFENWRGWPGGGVGGEARSAPFRMDECGKAAVQVVDVVPFAVNPLFAPVNLAVEIIAVVAFYDDIKMAAVSPWRKGIATALLGAQVASVFTGTFTPSAVITSVFEVPVLSLSNWLLNGSPSILDPVRKSCGMSN